MPVLRPGRADTGPAHRYIEPRPAPSGLSALYCRDTAMTGTTRSSQGLDDRRKRLLFRCWHRGTREMDLILGRFADAEIGTLSEGELAELEQLLEVPDPDFYAAVTGARPLPPEQTPALFARIKAFRAADAD
ncbi:antitoxin CptB [Bradyrhizobium sp. USDA 4369]|jgi:antitoxin CptB